VDGPIPASLPADVPLVIAYRGPDFFADVAAVADAIPDPTPGRPGVVVLHLGDLQAFSSTTLKTLHKLADRYSRAGSGIVLTGVGEAARETLARTGLLEVFGAANIVGDDPHLGADLDAGLERGQALLAELQGGAVRG
jgi:hypothetical protein